MEATPNDPITAAFELLESARLPPNDYWLLERFVLGSLVPTEAAQYVLNRRSREAGAKSLEDTLLSLKTDLEFLDFKGMRVLLARDLTLILTCVGSQPRADSVPGYRCRCPRT